MDDGVWNQACDRTKVRHDDSFVLLTRVGLPQYLPLEQAVRSGSIRTLNQALEANQHRFIMEVRIPAKPYQNLEVSAFECCGNGRLPIQCRDGPLSPFKACVLVSGVADASHMLLPRRASTCCWRS